MEIKEIHIALSNGKVLRMITHDLYKQNRNLFKQILKNKDVIKRGYFNPKNIFVDRGHVNKYEDTCVNASQYLIGDNITIDFKDDMVVTLRFLYEDKIKDDNVTIVLSDNSKISIQDFLALVNMSYESQGHGYDKYYYIGTKYTNIELIYEHQLFNRDRMEVFFTLG